MAKFYRTRLLPSERHPIIAWAYQHGKVIKQLRAELGISDPALHYWDTGVNKPSWPMLQKIERLTNGSVTPEMCFEYWRAQRQGDAT